MGCLGNGRKNDVRDFANDSEVLGGSVMVDRSTINQIRKRFEEGPKFVIETNLSVNDIAHLLSLCDRQQKAIELLREYVSLVANYDYGNRDDAAEGCQECLTEAAEILGEEK
jgi:hypothetical protein